MTLHSSGQPYSNPRYRGCGEELNRESLTLLSKPTLREREERERVLVGGWGML